MIGAIVGAIFVVVATGSMVLALDALENSRSDAGSSGLSGSEGRLFDASPWAKRSDANILKEDLSEWLKNLPRDYDL